MVQFEKMIELNMLYDFYGQLLTEKQRKIFTLYHEDNLSLAEIAEEVKISRQGVHDALKKSEKALYKYENKLKLIKKFSQTQKAVLDIDNSINEIISENMQNDKLTKRLKKIKNIIDNLND
ncbi:YlxM family DNA-binding protein [Anaerovorax odorimutans]|uniref:YlxM family DNA-binding protein n=1 Tax=Anaerovorax odorimutans TaxID=109327 RepID=UPI00042621FD|nr:putative DNA-binding protein [Anaerovorax odorimutans]